MTPAISEIEKQINNYFDDRTRPVEDTIYGLTQLNMLIERMLATLERGPQ